MERKALGPYQLIRLLGRGGMGEVYLAKDARLDRHVALKILSPDLAATTEFRERFLHEARAGSALNHPNVTTIHEIGEAEGLHYIAFEHVDGQTLESLLVENERLAVDKLLALALPLAEGLEHAHQHGIVHRDLKPANVVISALGIPKILDFGLAKMLPHEVSSESPTLPRLTQAGTVVGTISYMSPEQALGKGVDNRSDIFSFGCLLYEMASGHPPFRGSTATQVLDSLLHTEPNPLDRIRPELPAELARVVEKALRKDPSERYQHMADLAADLRHLIRESGRQPLEDYPRLRGASRSLRRTWKWATVAITLALCGMLGAQAWRHFRPSPPPVPGSVGVMYFENLTDPADADNTGRMLTSLLTNELSGAEALEVVSRQRLYDVAKHLGQKEGIVDRSVATEVARRAGVGTMVLGKVARAGGRLVATAELVDVATGRSLASQKAEGESIEDVFVIAETLGARLRREMERSTALSLPPAAREGLPGLTRSLTASVDAYRAYVEGESLLQRAEFEGALEEFREAVRIDPEFALAHFRLSIAARWLSDGILAHRAARRAVALVERAPPEYQDVVRANALYQEGAYSQAIPLLEAALAASPDLKEALYILSQIYVHSARDGDTRRAIELMERLLALDPEFYLVYDRLALAYAFQGEVDKAREKMAQWDGIRPEKVEGLRALLATLEGQPEEALGFGQAFTWIEGPLFQAAAAMLASRWDVARRIVAQDPDDWRTDQLRAWAFRNRATFHAYLGEFEEAEENYRHAGRAGGFRTHEGGSGGVPASALQALAELQEMRGELMAARRETEKALALQPESPRCLYFAGRMALRNGDPEAAEGDLRLLSSLPAASTSASAMMYRLALEAELELARGRLVKARELLESLIRLGKPFSDWASTCSSAGAVFRDALARAHLALGEREKAMAALEGLIMSGFERLDHPVLYVRALYELGIMKLQSGDRAGGRKLLRKFLQHWGATSELQEVADARGRLGL